MAAEMDWNLLNQHLMNMEVKMNEMVELAEQDVCWLNGAESDKLREMVAAIKTEMERTKLSMRAEYEFRNMEMALCEMKKEKEEAAHQNLSLQIEVEGLLRRLAMKEKELSTKEEELGRLKIVLFGEMQRVVAADQSDQEDWFKKLPEDCIVNIIALTSPRDAGRVSVLGTAFKSASEYNAVWEAFLASDHMQEIILESMKLVPPALTAKDLFLQLAETNILIDGGTKTFSMDRWTARKSYMLGARSLQTDVVDRPVGTWNFISAPGSRFPEAVELVSGTWFGIRGKISKKLLSLDTLYETYLVYKLTPESFGFENQPMEVSWGCGDEGECDYQTIFFYHSFINNMMENEHVERGDGWLEIKIDEYFTREGRDTDGFLHVEISEIYGDRLRGGLIVEGIEIRPILE